MTAARVVADASAVAAFLLREPGWRGLAPLLAHSVSVDHVVKEVANALWKAARRGLLGGGEEEARRLYGLLGRLVGVNIVLLPEERYVDRAFELALAAGLTVYDMLYVALAVEEGLPLLTLDEAQAAAAERVGVRVVGPLRGG